MKCNLSKYSVGIVGFNLLAILFLSLYLWKGWHYRVFPTMDLIFFKEMIITFLTVPLYAIWINKLNEAKVDATKFKRGLIVFLFIFFVAIYGSGMHNSANQIRSVIDEPIVFFYDEILSHYIFLTALFGMGMCISLLQTNSPNKEKLSRCEKVLIIISGIFQGIVIGIGSLEAHYGMCALIFSLTFFILLYIKVRKSTINHFPLTWYYLINFFTTQAFLFLFIFFNKNFTEPSAFGFGIF